MHSVATNRAGDAVVVSSAFTQLIGEELFATSFDRDGGWQSTEELDERDADIASAAIDEDGTTTIAWRNIGGLAPDVWATRRERGADWGEPEKIGDAQSGAGLDQDPSVAVVVGPGAHTRVAWAQANGTWINRFTPGFGWGYAKVIREGITDRAELGVDGAGRTFAVWPEDDELWATIEIEPQTP